MHCSDLLMAACHARQTDQHAPQRCLAVLGNRGVADEDAAIMQPYHVRTCHDEQCLHMVLMTVAGLLLALLMIS